jgi:hypothetical protein
MRKVYSKGDFLTVDCRQVASVLTKAAPVGPVRYGDRNLDEAGRRLAAVKKRLDEIAAAVKRR